MEICINASQRKMYLLIFFSSMVKLKLESTHQSKCHVKTNANSNTNSCYSLLGSTKIKINMN